MPLISVIQSKIIAFSHHHKLSPKAASKAQLSTQKAKFFSKRSNEIIYCHL